MTRIMDAAGSRGSFGAKTPIRMIARTHPMIWIARSLAVAVALFLAVFALDALRGEVSLAEKLAALAKHLAPTWLCITAVLVSWRREWIGTLLFTTFALAYAWWARAHLDWILIIGGPLLSVAASYLLAWRERRSERTVA